VGRWLDGKDEVGDIFWFGCQERRELSPILLMPNSREVRHRAVLGRDRPRDDAVDSDVSGKVLIGLLKQLAREIQLGLGYPLSEVEVYPVGHVRAAPVAPRGQTARLSSRGLAPQE